MASGIPHSIGVALVGFRREGTKDSNQQFMPLFGFKKHQNPLFNLQGNQGIEATILGEDLLSLYPAPRLAAKNKRAT